MAGHPREAALPDTPPVGEWAHVIWGPAEALMRVQVRSRAKRRKVRVRHGAHHGDYYTSWFLVTCWFPTLGHELEVCSTRFTTPAEEMPCIEA